MTEDELKARGFPGGDAELRKEWRRLFGGEPSYIVTDPGWLRGLIFNDVMLELNRQVSGAKVAKLDVPSVGSWHEPEE